MIPRLLSEMGKREEPAYGIFETCIDDSLGSASVLVEYY